MNVVPTRVILHTIFVCEMHLCMLWAMMEVSYSPVVTVRMELEWSAERRSSSLSGDGGIKLIRTHLSHSQIGTPLQHPKSTLVQGLQCADYE